MILSCGQQVKLIHVRRQDQSFKLDDRTKIYFFDVAIDFLKKQFPKDVDQEGLERVMRDSKTEALIIGRFDDKDNFIVFGVESFTFFPEENNMPLCIYIDYIALTQDTVQKVTSGKSKYITGVKEHGFGTKMLQLLQLCGNLYYSTWNLTLVVQSPLSFYQRLQFQEVDKAEVERHTSLVYRI